MGNKQNEKLAVEEESSGSVRTFEAPVVFAPVFLCFFAVFWYTKGVILYKGKFTSFVG